MALLLLLPVLLPVASHDASGSSVEVTEGAGSVTLPCQGLRSVPHGSTVVWDRDDLRVPTVHVRQPDGDYLRDQNPRFQHRTSMKEDALQTGDLSLTLRTPTFTDSGTFTCTVRRLGEDLHREAVELLVKEASVWPWVLGVLGVLVVLMVLGAAAVWYYIYKKKTKAGILSETVEIREGVKSVRLPFKTDRGLPQDVRVEWTYSDQSNNTITIHLVENGETRCEQQDHGYKGRTKMKADLQVAGDVSLTLKNPQLKDGGVYECAISRGGNKLQKKNVTLRVKENLMEEVEVPNRQDFVFLPFKTAADLPPETRVVWKRTDQSDTVHEFQSGLSDFHRQNQMYRDRTEMNPRALENRDLTLTLKNPGLEDSGVFLCTIYNSSGKTLGRKVVTLTVKVSQVEKVTVEEGGRWVVLPFKAAPGLLSESVTVEWRLSDQQDRLLHSYHGGRLRPTEDGVYKDHTEMEEALLTTGDLCLTIRDIHLTDNVYTCSIYNQHREILQQKVVFLIVRALQTDIVEITKGETSVSLPCKMEPPLDEDIRVEWTHPGSKKAKVITFEKGDVQASEQDQVYRRRADLHEDLLTSGDLSLRLKNPCAEDNGLYVCTVYRGTNVKLKKMVTLSVREPMNSSFTDRLLSRRGAPTDSPTETVPLRGNNPSIGQA